MDAISVVLELARQGLISREEALRRVTPAQVDAVMAPHFSATERQAALSGGRLLGRGLPAYLGAASGQVVLDAGRLIDNLMHDSPPQVLLCPDVAAQEVVAFYNASAVVATEGGQNCPAAHAARKWGVPCVVGCHSIEIDRDRRCFHIDGRTYPEGDWISVDATRGEVFCDAMPLEDPDDLPADLEELLGWADAVARIEVFANADSPDDVARARRFGAKGVGLCRTERILNHTERLHLVYPLILAAPEAERFQRDGDVAPAERDRLSVIWHCYQIMLDSLQPLLRADFRSLLEAVQGRPITVRLLDAPLNTFLPAVEDMLLDVVRRRILERFPEGAAVLQSDRAPLFHLGRHHDELSLAEREVLLTQLRRIQPQNPSFGLRVCRQGIVYPEIYRMQLRALFEAACDVADVQLQIMIPGTSHPNELSWLRDLIAETAREVFESRARVLPYRVGTMIELPRACLEAGALGRLADFFWCGTNDLTQAVWGMSGYDSSYTFLPVYLEKQVLEDNPFQVLDEAGVGSLLQMAVERGRAANPRLEVGICGDQGSDPRGIAFCQEVGMNFVSTDPRRVPGARLAAALAALR